MIFMVPATSQSSSQMPGVVGLKVVVVVVVVEEVLVISLMVGGRETLADDMVAVRAASSSFSIEIGVVEMVGQPVNSVVTLKALELAF
jgi:hypothetical protein